MKGRKTTNGPPKFGSEPTLPQLEKVWEAELTEQADDEQAKRVLGLLGDQLAKTDPSPVYQADCPQCGRRVSSATREFHCPGCRLWLYDYTGLELGSKVTSRLFSRFLERNIEFLREEWLQAIRDIDDSR